MINVFQRKLKKELLEYAISFFIFSLLMCIVIKLGMKEGEKEVHPIVFVFGLPLIIYSIIVLKDLIKIPRKVKLNNNNIQIDYIFNSKNRILYWNDIKEVFFIYHSSKNLQLRLLCQNFNSKKNYDEITFRMNNWYEFQHFFMNFKQIVKENNIENKDLFLPDITKKDLYEIEKVDWYEIFNLKLTFKEVFINIKQEGIVKKILFLIGFIILLALRLHINIFKDYVLIICSSIALCVYIIVNVLFRKKGYSKQESRLNAGGAVVLLLLGIVILWYTIKEIIMIF